jgi:hypothetical protein
MNTNPNITKAKRRYVGYNLVKNTVLDYLASDGVTTHTAREIANAHALIPSSIRMIARKMGVKVKRDGNWGGRRSPCNHLAKQANG